MNILRPQRKTRVKYPRRLPKRSTIASSDELWEIDIKYGYIAGEDRFFFLMSILDVFDREIIDYHIGLSCLAWDAAFIIESALLKRGLYNSNHKPVIRTDNGPQFVAHIFEEKCSQLNIKHERIPCASPNMIAHIESFL